jgi:hypothetical protein
MHKITYPRLDSPSIPVSNLILEALASSGVPGCGCCEWICTLLLSSSMYEGGSAYSGVRGRSIVAVKYYAVKVVCVYAIVL